jgi:acyl-CoA synthetase (AMP-forming)/AMP-acid ligase II
MTNGTLDYFVTRALRRHAGRVAIVDGGRQATYSDLDRASTALAASLLRLGCQKGDRVALLLNNGIEFIETELGILRAGLVKVPVNNRLSAAEVAALVSDSGAKVLFVDAEFLEGILAQRAQLDGIRAIVSQAAHAMVLSYADLLKPCPSAPGGLETAGSDLCMIRYSGGTTGKPKGIMHSHSSLVAIALSVVREYGLTAEDRFLHVAHLSHGQNFVWPALLAVGARLVMLKKFDPLAVLQAIERERITRVHLVPTMANAVLDAPSFSSHDLSSLRNFVYASAPMPVERIRRLREALRCRISQTYTLSESAVISTTLSAEDHAIDRPGFDPGRLSSCGREALDVRIRIVDDSMNDVSEGEVGEIALLSPGNMMGYWNQPELTARVLMEGWVLSGDLARRDADGYLYLVDRKDDKIITGGLNVYPREIEEVLHQHAAVHEASVGGIPDERWGEAIVAFVVVKPGCACSAEDLAQFCESRLSGYKKPKRFVFVGELPRTAIGKIARRQLTEPFWAGQQRRIH